MKIGNHLLKSFATGYGSLTIEAESIEGDNVIDSEVISKLATKYIKARWPHEKEWFLVDSYNNSVRFALMVHPIGDGSINIKDKNYQVYIKHDRETNICKDDIVVARSGRSVCFAEIVNPIVFYLTNKELFNAVE